MPTLSKNPDAPRSAPFHQGRPDSWPQPGRSLATLSEVRARAACAQLDLGMDCKHPLLWPGELAADWSCSDVHIRNLIESGTLLAFSISAFDDPARATFVIPRVGVLAQGLSLTASGREDIIRQVDLWLFCDRYGNPVAKKNFTVNEAAFLLRSSPSHVRNLHRHQGLGSDIGNGPKELALRISRSQLAAFVQKRLMLNHQST